MALKDFSNAMEECPRFEFCQLNRCPLDVNYPKLENDISDPAIQKKQKCLAKSIRKRIGLKWKLKNKGMTPREITSQKNWDNLPEDVKKARIDKLKGLSPLSRCLEKGLVVTPKKKSSPSNPYTNQEKEAKNNAVGVGQ